MTAEHDAELDASSDDLAARVADWIARDPDPRTRAELEALRDAGRRDELEARFAGRLEFGTAGIRGELGAGPMRMNRVVVREVSAGIAARLAADGGLTGRTVVVGRDARHGSGAFADDAAAVFTAAGFRVLSFTEPVPTPLTAWATRYLGAAAGVQITASHNPPTDNGYKVYWQGGAQIVAPLDEEIARCITAVDVPDDLTASPRPEAVPDEVATAYRRAALDLCRGGGRRDLTIVYTPLHGVAGTLVTDLLGAAGFTDVHVVEEQFAPDPDFPTVEFPNPEVPGALDLAARLAEDVGGDLVLANDPDGDRIAVAVPDRGYLRVLTGDEVGCLLADALLAEGLGAGDEPRGARMVATTAVSSQLLQRIAEARGAAFAETLTGFKWLARAAAAHLDEGTRPVVCYEQALGVMLDDVVRDKDGITAALVVADLAARRGEEGTTLLDALDDLARRHGLHVTTGRSLRLTGREEGLATRIVDALRADPPARVLGVQLVRVDDYVDLQRRHADGTTEPIDLPASPLVSWVLADGSRLQARPSGTEPLLKFYVEVVEPVADADVEATRSSATARLEALADAFVELASNAVR